MLYARVEHKELWAIIVILLTSMSYFDSAVLLDEAAGPTLRVRLREAGSTDVLRTQVAGVGERSNFKKIPTHTQDHGDA